ncbi:MAG: peptide chain release factor N(5)-glutamine methyltransferase [Dermatophilaceae bacterium]
MAARSARPTIAAAVAHARLVFQETGIVSAETDAVELAAFALARDRATVRHLMVLREATPPGFLERYDRLVEERHGRVPLQHLTGRAYFRRLTLAVGPGVFVPRPETEVVVGLALNACRGIRHPVVLDLCTGSGAVAFSVKDERPDAEVHAVELSPEAHAWAEMNRARLGLDVDLRCGDATTAFADLEGVADVVVSNPPYIPDGAVPVDPEVRDHDPALALYGRSADGLAVPLAVAARAALLLRPGGVLVMEHADSQGGMVAAALEASGRWAETVDHADLTGRPRAVVAIRRRRGDDRPGQ